MVKKRSDNMSEFTITVGNTIAWYRRQAKLSQDKLAKEIGCSRNHVYEIESGQTSPSLDEIRIMCDILQVTVIDLIPYPKEYSNNWVKETLFPVKNYLKLKPSSRTVINKLIIEWTQSIR